MLEKYKHELSETKGITAQLKNSREVLNNRVKIQLLNWWKTELIKLSRKHRANENGKYKNHFRDEEDRMGKSNIFPPRIPEGKQRENIKEAIFAFLFFFLTPASHVTGGDTTEPMRKKWDNICRNVTKNFPEMTEDEHLQMHGTHHIPKRTNRWTQKIPAPEYTTVKWKEKDKQINKNSKEQ